MECHQDQITELDREDIRIAVEEAACQAEEGCHLDRIAEDRRNGAASVLRRLLANHGPVLDKVEDRDRRLGLLLLLLENRDQVRDKVDEEVMVLRRLLGSHDRVLDKVEEGDHLLLRDRVEEVDRSLILLLRLLGSHDLVHGKAGEVGMDLLHLLVNHDRVLGRVGEEDRL